MQIKLSRYKRSVSAALLAGCFFICLPAHGQDESRRVQGGQVQVGDRIMAHPTSSDLEMDTCTVTSYKQGLEGDKCDHNGWTSVPATGDHGKVIPQMMAVAALRPNAIANTNAAQTVAAGGNAFGSRNPRMTCPPSGPGVPSFSLAAELVVCSREGQSSQRGENLVSDVRVTSMTKSVYDPYTQTGFTNMDTRVPPMAIVGSLQAWSCRLQDPPTVMAKYSNVGQNCSHWTESNSQGYCWKLRTGSWSCVMTDTAGMRATRKDNLPPPQ